MSKRTTPWCKRAADQAAGRIHFELPAIGVADFVKRIFRYLLLLVYGFAYRTQDSPCFETIFFMFFIILASDTNNINNINSSSIFIPSRQRDKYRHSKLYLCDSNNSDRLFLPTGIKIFRQTLIMFTRNIPTHYLSSTTTLPSDKYNNHQQLTQPNTLHNLHNPNEPQFVLNYYIFATKVLQTLLI